MPGTLRLPSTPPRPEVRSDVPFGVVDVHVLAEVADVAARRLREEVPRYLDHAAVLGLELLHDPGLHAGDGLRLGQHRDPDQFVGEEPSAISTSRLPTGNRLMRPLPFQ